MNKVILADNSGFCFGVKRAVEEALKVRDSKEKNIYTLGPIIHNDDVVNMLRSKGVYPIDESEIMNLQERDVIIIRSHGIPKYLYDILKEKNLEIIDTTCPYVKNIQKKVEKYYSEGYKILIIGDPQHPEIIGINGWCNNTAIIFKNGEVNEKLPNKVCIVSQTTEKMENWNRILRYVVENCKEFLAFNTICSATELRQKNAFELSETVDAMIVIGGKESSNSKKLYEICKSQCENTIFVERAEEISEKFMLGHEKKIIGITAGASTPDWIIKEAILKMEQNKNLEFNEQLAYMEANDKQIFVGEKIKGKVISVTEKEIYVDINYKSDAVIPSEEFIEEEREQLPKLYNAGDEIEAKVISRMNDDGYVVLSRTEIFREVALLKLEKAFNEGEKINVLIKASVNGGLVALFKGVKVFIPASHLDLVHVEDLNSYLGKNLEVKIIEFKIERDRTKIVASKRVILEAEKKIREEEAWNALTVDEILEGEVKRLTDFGAFIDVKGIDGLLHISELSWGRVKKVSDVLKIGEKVKVKIIGLDKEKNKISLSIKALINDPWLDVDQKYPVGNIVLGKVVRFTDFGAFIELEPGIDGLVHISQITHRKLTKPEEFLKIGENIKAKILEVNAENKRISLSIKAID